MCIRDRSATPQAPEAVGQQPPPAEDVMTTEECRASFAKAKSHRSAGPDGILSDLSGDPWFQIAEEAQVPPAQPQPAQEPEAPASGHHQPLPQAAAAAAAPQPTEQTTSGTNYANVLADDRALRRPRPTTTASQEEAEGFRSRDHFEAVLMRDIADKEIVAPTSLFPMLEASLTGMTVVTDAKRAHLREQVRKITDIFPSQDDPLPRADIHAALSLFVGRSPSILKDYDIRLIITELLQEMQAPSYQEPTEQQADVERSQAEADLAAAQRGLAYLKLEQPTKEIYDQMAATGQSAAKAHGPALQVGPPAESWTAARGTAEPTEASSHHKPSGVPTDKDRNIWMGTPQWTGGRAGGQRAYGAHAVVRRQGPPAKPRRAGPDLSHLLHIQPDASATPIAASTTGLHHPSQPGVWAQDASAGGHQHRQPQTAHPTAASSSGEPTDNRRLWPTYDKACADERQ